MVSISVPCPKCSVTPRGVPWRPGPQQQVLTVSVPNPLLARSARFPSFQVPNRSQSLLLKAQVHELKTSSSNGQDAEILEESSGQAAVSGSAISTFMAEASELVKLVDSKDITELQLKQKDCELIIRKKEALPQPAPVVMMQPPPHAGFPAHTSLPLSVPAPTPAASAPSAAAPALLPSVKGSKSSLPPLKSPMAGTFYRCPAPGEPPYVKVGDKVKKGQMVCIIEAMKLMNEIEADQSGTVVEILVEDGKPVSADMPLFIIEP